MNQNLILIFAALLAFVGGMYFKQKNALPDIQVENHPALDISFPDHLGKQRHISEWQGKIQIINFWATWCPPCLKEIPEFVKLQTKLADQNVQFIGIAIESAEPVQAYLAKNPVNYPMLIADDSGINLTQQLGNMVGAIPFTVIINSKGQMIYRHPGELKPEVLLEKLESLFQR